MTLSRFAFGAAAAALSIAASLSSASAFVAERPGALSTSTGPNGQVRQTMAAPQTSNRPNTGAAGHTAGVEDRLGGMNGKDNGSGGGGIPGIKTGSVVSGGVLKDVGSGRPSTAAGRVAEKVGTIKGAQGQSQGRDQNEGASGRQADHMQKELGELKTGQGKPQGRDSNAAASAKQAVEMKGKLDQASASRGQEQGRDSSGAGVKLTDQQLKEAKASTVNPKVNQDAASDPSAEQQKADKAAAERKKEIDKISHLFDFAKEKTVKTSALNEKYQAIKPTPPPKIGGSQ